MDDLTVAHELLKQIEKNERINCSRSVMPIIQEFLRTFALQQRAVAYRRMVEECRQRNGNCWVAMWNRAECCEQQASQGEGA